MKSLNLYGIQDVRLEEMPVPNVCSREVLVKVEVAGICGSDVSRFGKIGPYNPGMTWGHEFSGVISEVGSEVTKLKVGDRVTACPCFPCFECSSCKKARYSQCDSLEVLGGHRNGAFAEYLKLPEENVIRIPDSMSFEEASFIEPSCVVVHGFNQISIKAGESVAIVGCGTIGLLAVQWAKVFGAKEVFVFDTDDYKLDVAKQCGADYAYNVTDTSYLESFNKQTQHLGVGVVVESSGNQSGIASSLMLASKGGQVVLLGIPYGDVSLPRQSFERVVRAELKVIGSWNSLSAPFPGTEWETSLFYLSSGKINIKPLLTKTVSLEEASNLFPSLFQRDFPFTKVVINFS